MDTKNVGSAISNAVWGSSLAAYEQRRRMAHRPTFKLEGSSAILTAVFAVAITTLLAMVAWQVRYGVQGPLMIAAIWTLGAPAALLWGLLAGRVPHSAAAVTQAALIWALGLPAVALLVSFGSSQNAVWLLMAAPFVGIAAPLAVRFYKHFVVHQRVSRGPVANRRLLLVAACVTLVIVAFIFFGVKPVETV